MILLIDMGNSRIKWQVRELGAVLASGAGELDLPDLFDGLEVFSKALVAIAVSTVASDAKREKLVERLAGESCLPVTFHWTEANRNGLKCTYAEPLRMGADRWHAMYGAWRRAPGASVVIDAGSALTVDFIGADGAHGGGYIIAGRQMMLRSLSRDAARIDYDEPSNATGEPGKSTTDCVHHGLHWLWRAIAARLNAEAGERNVTRVYVTGGDASCLLQQGLIAEHVPDLVIEGLEAIVREGRAE